MRRGIRIFVVLATAGLLAAAVVPAPAPPLVDAAERGDVALVRSLLAEGADVAEARGDGTTALHWAALGGHSEVARLLVDAGAPLEATSRLGGYTPLHLAAQSGSAGTVRVLLEAGADVHATTTTGAVRPIHYAADAGDAEAVRLLLERGADPNAREQQWGQTPLMFAAAKDRTAAVRTLAATGADVEARAWVVDIVQRAEEDGRDRSARNRRLAGLPPRDDRDRDDPPSGAYGAAATTGEPLTAQEAAALVDREGETEGTLSYSDLVGTQGGLTALHLAVREGYDRTAFALLELGADIDQVSGGDETSPLLMATINGHYDLAMRLLERGADPTVVSVAEATPLYATINVEWAPKSRHPQPTDSRRQSTTYLELMEALLVAGADPNVRLNRRLWYTTYSRDDLGVNRTGATAFWRAAHATDVPAMKLLVAYGADPGIGTLRVGRRGGDEDERGGEAPGPAPDAVEEYAVMPIHAASGVGYGQGYAGNSHRHAPEGWLPSVKYLVEEHGADVNARDLNDYTPLHHAASRGDNEMILYLVSKGADATAVSRRGQTTADMANGPVQRISPFPETVALLMKLGSKNNHRCLSCE